MSLPQTTGGYGQGPGEGEALWFNWFARRPALTVDQPPLAVPSDAPKRRPGYQSPFRVEVDVDSVDAFHQS
jgi:hypothetical protein